MLTPQETIRELSRRSQTPRMFALNKGEFVAVVTTLASVTKTTPRLSETDVARMGLTFNGSVPLDSAEEVTKEWAKAFCERVQKRLSVYVLTAPPDARDE